MYAFDNRIARNYRVKALVVLSPEDRERDPLANAAREGHCCSARDFPGTAPGRANLGWLRPDCALRCGLQTGVDAHGLRVSTADELNDDGFSRFDNDIVELGQQRDHKC
jgi:hypothetical protein